MYHKILKIQTPQKNEVNLKCKLTHVEWKSVIYLITTAIGEEKKPHHVESLYLAGIQTGDSLCIKYPEQLVCIQLFLSWF